MAKYPHLLPNERRIWEKFLELMGKKWERFEYDVRVGKGIDPGPKVPEPWRSLAIKLTQKRIDVVGYAEDGIWLFEVKPDASLGALGQVLAYKYLYMRDKQPTEPVHVAIVTNRTFPDEKEIYRHYDVRYFEVGEI